MSDTHEQSHRLEVLKDHPCFSNEAHGCSGRIHLPVAPKCNIQCGYCNRKYDCANESRPGVSSTVMSAQEAMDYIERNNVAKNRLKVIGIAGPGEPLANEQTFLALEFAQQHYPQMLKCISSNGLMLEETLERLVASGVDSITVTVNTLNPETAERIYSYIGIADEGTEQPHKERCERFIQRQLSGIKKTINQGIKVKINTVYIPGVNDVEIPAIAEYFGKLGVVIMNIMPLIPQGKFIDTTPPTKEEIAAMQEICNSHVQQLYGCCQCRADAVGIPVKEEQFF